MPSRSTRGRVQRRDEILRFLTPQSENTPATIFVSAAWESDCFSRKLAGGETKCSSTAIEWPPLAQRIGGASELELLNTQQALPLRLIAQTIFERPFRVLPAQVDVDRLGVAGLDERVQASAYRRIVENRICWSIPELAERFVATMWAVVVPSPHGTSGEGRQPRSRSRRAVGRWAATLRTARRLRLVTSGRRASRNGSNGVFALGPSPRYLVGLYALTATSRDGSRTPRGSRFD
jgi:hypothetical protein